MSFVAGWPLRARYEAWLAREAEADLGLRAVAEPEIDELSGIVDFADVSSPSTTRLQVGAHQRQVAVGKLGTIFRVATGRPLDHRPACRIGCSHRLLHVGAAW